MAEQKRAAKTLLKPGSHSIDRNIVQERTDADGKKSCVLYWSVRLHDGRLIEKRTVGKSKSEVRRRAREIADDLLTTGGLTTWKLTDPLIEYIEKVTRPAILEAPIRPNSRSRYLVALGQLTGSEHHDRDRDRPCRHTHSLKGYSISSGTTFRALEACLKEIAALHGEESARQARSVVSKYLFQQLRADRLLQGDPLRGMTINLTSEKSTSRRRDGERLALTYTEWRTAVQYLLYANPAEGVPETTRGRWSLETRIANRRHAINAALIQASTGMRIGEVLSLRWVDSIDETTGRLHTYEGAICLPVYADVSKTKKARNVPVLVPVVGQWLTVMHDAAESEQEYIVSAPADPLKPWDQRNAQDQMTVIYKTLHKITGADPLLTTAGGAHTHVWRATLNKLLQDVDQIVRSAALGHDPAVNSSSYTDRVDVSPLIRAARTVLAIEPAPLKK